MSRPIPRSIVAGSIARFRRRGSCDHSAALVDPERHDRRGVPRVPDHVLDRLEAAEVHARLDVRIEAARREPGSCASTVASAPTFRMCASSAGTMPWSASNGGKMPRARSRSVVQRRVGALTECVELCAGGRRVTSGQRLDRVETLADQPELVFRTLVDVALEPATLRVAGGHQPLARQPQGCRLLVQLDQPDRELLVQAHVVQGESRLPGEVPQQLLLRVGERFAARLRHRRSRRRPRRGRRPGTSWRRVPTASSAGHVSTRSPFGSSTRTLALRRAHAATGRLGHLRQHLVDRQRVGHARRESRHHLIRRGAGAEHQPVRQRLRAVAGRTGTATPPPPSRRSTAPARRPARGRRGRRRSRRTRRR